MENETKIEKDKSMENETKIETYKLMGNETKIEKDESKETWIEAEGKLFIFICHLLYGRKFRLRFLS